MFSKRIPRGKIVAITVHWSAQLACPAEIRHKIGRVPVAVLSGAVATADDHASDAAWPAAFAMRYAERRDKEMSGWVRYLSGPDQEHRYGDPVHLELSPRAVRRRGSDEAVTPQTIADTRKQVDASLNAEDVVGSVVQVALTLAVAAAQGLPLKSASMVTPGVKRKREKGAIDETAASLAVQPSSEKNNLAAELPSAAATIAKALQAPTPLPNLANVGKDGRPPPSLLLRSAASGGDIGVTALYERMIALVGPSASAQMRKTFLSELSMSPQDEPSEFFQVALDMPGHGKVTTLRKSDEHVTADLLSDVIRALGKQSAFAIVGAAEAAPGILQAVLERPSLCSFLVLVDPHMPKSAEALFGVFQPTLFVGRKSFFGKRTAHVQITSSQPSD